MSGLDSGIAIPKKKRKSDAPSSCAASRSSGERFCWRNVRAMIRFHTPTAPGSTTAHRVLSMPSSFTTRYRAIMPPSKNIVITNRIMNRLRPGMSLLLSA